MQKIFFLLVLISFHGRADITFNLNKLECNSNVVRIPVSLQDEDNERIHYLPKIVGTDSMGNEFELPVEPVDSETRVIEFYTHTLDQPFIKISIEILGVKIEKECKKNTS